MQSLQRPAGRVGRQGGKKSITLSHPLQFKQAPMHRPPLPSPHFICARCDTRRTGKKCCEIASAHGDRDNDLRPNSVSVRPAAYRIPTCASLARHLFVLSICRGRRLSLSLSLALSPLRTSCESETALSGKRHTAVSLRQKVGAVRRVAPTKTRLLFNKILQHRGRGQEKVFHWFSQLAKSAVFTAPCGFDKRREFVNRIELKIPRSLRCTSNKLLALDFSQQTGHSINFPASCRVFFFCKMQHNNFKHKLFKTI